MNHLQGILFFEVNDDEIKAFCFNCHNHIYAKKITDEKNITAEIVKKCPLCNAEFKKIAGQFYK